MKGIWKQSFAVLSLTAMTGVVEAQLPIAKEQPTLPATTTTETVVRPTGNAAKVNNQAIAEAAVVRALKAVPVEDRTKARPEIVQFLVDNVLIDQYLTAIKIAVEPIDIEKQMVDFRTEVKKHGQDYAKVLQNLLLTEEELREQIVGQIRWDLDPNPRRKSDCLTPPSSPQPATPANDTALLVTMSTRRQTRTATTRWS